MELSNLDLRYKNLRIQNRKQEGGLLLSIAERGIEEPLEGADIDGVHVLLNGFKRYRCAKKLNISTVPYTSLGQTETQAIVTLLQKSQTSNLSILEQAAFVDQLRTLEEMSVNEIAEVLSRSKAWVSLRIGLIRDMTDTIHQKMFNGMFPVRSYMYTLRKFTRVNAVSRNEVDKFVAAVSGRNLSIRQIEQLAYDYFTGSDELRRQINGGKIDLVLARHQNDTASGCNRFEQGLLKELSSIQKSMQTVMTNAEDKRLKTPAFFAQANILTGRISKETEKFIQTIKRLYDRTRQT
jgi:hypothetical protein